MRTEQISLLKADPDLGGLLAEQRRAEAERRLLVSTHRLGVGPWDVTRLAGASADHIGLLVLDGVVARELIVADHVSAELLGPGDLIRPWQAASKSELLPVDAEWSVLSPSTLAVLDRRFAAEVSQYPEVTAALFDRLSERSLRLATTQAISQLTRVDRRLKALFWHLAERWGRVGGDGVVIPLALTHRILGQLVGARRPTVSTALSRARRARRARAPRRRLLAAARRPAGRLDARALAPRATRASATCCARRGASRARRTVAPAATPRTVRPATVTRKETAMAVRNASEGILSDDKAQQREELIELLKKAYWMEIETVMSYIANSINPDGVRAQEIIESLQEDIQEELGHAQQFAARIKELYGVVPGSLDFNAEQSYLQPPEHQTDIVHVIKGVIEAETGAIEHYNRIIEFTDGLDFVTQDMVIAILRDEEGHRRLFEGYLREYEVEGLA